MKFEIFNHLAKGVILLYFGIVPLYITAQEVSEKYHLFNPTPKEKLRALSTDRPDVTETPYTVDAGHFQFEGDMVNFSKHPNEKVKRLNERDFYIVNSIFKLGITHNSDIELGLSLYQWHIVEENKQLNRRGFGDMFVRYKINLIGNDVENFGLAIMPSFQFALNNAASDNINSPGLTVIWAKNFDDKFEISGQFEQFKILPNNRNTLINENYNQTWVTFAISRDLSEKISLFTEYVQISTWKNDTEFFVNGGIIFMLKDMLHVDFAVQNGINNSSFVAFTGLSFKI